jgi:hypothetical protein
VNFLAWVASSGAPFISYLISDAVASPPEFEADYSEKLLLFPYSYFPTDLRSPPPSFSSLPLRAVGANTARSSGLNPNPETPKPETLNEAEGWCRLVTLNEAEGWCRFVPVFIHTQRCCAPNSTP